MNAKGLKRITELSVEKADAVKGGAKCVCSAAACKCGSSDTTASAKDTQQSGATAATDLQSSK